MIKDKLIVLDFDSCIIDTSKSIINLHNKLNPDKYIEYTPQHDWNFYPMINTKEDLKELFKLFDDKDSYRDWETDRKSTRLNSSHSAKSRMPSSA